MSQPCAATKCNRTSRGLCDCCTQHLCIQHLSEHNASLISQLNPLSDDINELGDRLLTLNIQKVVCGYRQKLEEWRMDSHQKIDCLFEKKCQELNRLADTKVEKQQEEIVRIKSKIDEIIRQQETTRQDIDVLTSTIHHLKEQMDKIEQMCLTITTRPLLIDDTLICIKEKTEHEFDLSTLPPIYKNIKLPARSKLVINSNDRFLLMHQKPNICLVDRDINVAKVVLWTHGDIYDMSWSATLNRFIVLVEKIVLLVDENTMAIDKVQISTKQDWLSCTCSETFLFLSTNGLASSIMKFRLLPSIEMVTEWKSPHTCGRNEVIDNILYNARTLSMTINHRLEKSLRIELRSAETLDCIWSLRFDTVCNQNLAFRCCLLICDEWLVMDYENNRLLHITKDGKLKATIPNDGFPRCANLFANMLVVSGNNGINFYQL
jgi:hypothetical protein